MSKFKGEDKPDLLDIGITVALVGTALLLTVILAFTQSLLSQRDTRYDIPAQTVLDFLAEYVPATSEVDQMRILEKYFSCLDKAFTDERELYQDLFNVNAVLLETGAQPAGFRICFARKHYIEFMLLDQDGNDLPCRVGMFYLTNNEGKISNYRLFRLLPISKTDSEWRRRWE